MMKLNVNMERVGRILKTGGALMINALVIGMAKLAIDKAQNAQYRIGEVGYSDAINTIVGSDMFDYNKSKVIELLKRDGDSEYYRAVITVVNSSMFDSTKVENIKTLSEK